MRIRPDKYYAIIIDRKGSQERIEVDDTDSQELIYTVCDTFPERLNGKRGTPFTKISVVEFDKSSKRNKTLTSGPIFNLSPVQVKERLLKVITKNN